MTEAAKPAPADFSSLAAVLAEMTAPRLAFQQFFDSYLAELPPPGPSEPPQPLSFLHAVFLGRRQLAAGSVADLANKGDAAALALLALGTTERMLRAAAALVAAGLFDPHVTSAGAVDDPVADAADGGINDSRGFATRRLWQALGSGDEMARLQRAALQKVTSRDVEFGDPDLLYPAILLARQRLCRVETIDSSGANVTGTGFLIGPSAVLTNWHVVENVPEPRATWPLTVSFDFKPSSGFAAPGNARFEARDSWRLDSSPTGPVEPQNASEGWWLDRAKLQAWHDSHADALDFAVVMLKGAPGLQRGWYRLDGLSAQALAGDCYVFHHPLGKDRSFNSGKFEFTTAPQRLRVFHSASTANGSSGGLLLDSHARPVALHYLGLGRDPFAPDPPPPAVPLPPPNVPDELVNVAVPLSAIAAKLAGKLADITRIDGPVLVRRSLADGRPVFGRTNLIEALGALARGDKRVLWVRPPDPGFKRPGKSYTLEILQSMFPIPGNLYVRFDADKVPLGEKAMAALILRQLSERAADELPDPLTTENAYDQILVNKVREIIADRWPAKTIWLVIDDLDVHDLTDAGGRRFLNALYARVMEIPQLRVVLIGLRVNLDSIPEAALQATEIARSELENVGPLFREWLLERGARDTPIDEKVTALIVDVLKSVAGTDAPLEMLGGFTSAHFGPALRTFFGEA